MIHNWNEMIQLLEPGKEEHSDVKNLYHSRFNFIFSYWFKDNLLETESKDNEIQHPIFNSETEDFNLLSSIFKLSSFWEVN